MSAKPRYLSRLSGLLRRIAGRQTFAAGGLVLGSSNLTELYPDEHLVVPTGDGAGRCVRPEHAGHACRERWAGDYVTISPGRTHGETPAQAMGQLTEGEDL